MQSIEGIYFRSRIIHGDLFVADTELSGQLGPTGTWIPFLKTALLSLGELADLEPKLRSLYREHPVLGEAMKGLEHDLRFTKYLRNVFVGHVNDELIAKTYEWRPELRGLPEERALNGTFALNLFVLETAINTYVLTAAMECSHLKPTLSIPPIWNVSAIGCRRQFNLPSRRVICSGTSPTAQSYHLTTVLICSARSKLQV